MGASFRCVEVILELWGCDILTISPGLIEELKRRFEESNCQLKIRRILIDQYVQHWKNQSADIIKMENIIEKKMGR